MLMPLYELPIRSLKTACIDPTALSIMGAAVEPASFVAEYPFVKDAYFLHCRNFEVTPHARGGGVLPLAVRIHVPSGIELGVWRTQRYML